MNLRTANEADFLVIKGLQGRLTMDLKAFSCCNNIGIVDGLAQSLTGMFSVKPLKLLAFWLGFKLEISFYVTVSISKDGLVNFNFLLALTHLPW